ncbi:hypothetical protein [Methylosinus sp. PW1]|uniref:hypothetical protein n=1 Tax=Methylosinus sp. PW1 TaxID=107636 RepID=UPI00056A6DDA|nr:hypothetical protein [Methylosinus sp. PW1]
MTGIRAAYDDLVNAHGAFCDSFEAAVRGMLSRPAAASLGDLMDKEVHGHPVTLELYRRAIAAAAGALSHTGTLEGVERAIADAAGAVESMLLPDNVVGFPSRNGR